MAKDRREHTLKVRVSEEELVALDERRGLGETRSAWMRRVLLGQRRRRPLPTVDPGLLRELTAIGSNLNQLTRLLNVARWEGLTDVHLQRAARALDGLRAEVAALAHRGPATADLEDEPGDDGEAGASP